MNFRQLATVGTLGFAVVGVDVASASDANDLVEKSASAQSALMRGDVDGYLAFVKHGPDFTLMAPFGGTPTHGFDESVKNKAALARFFKNGSCDQEVVATYESKDLVVLVTLERVKVEAGGTPLQDWLLRVTQVYRRDDAEWLLVHRHADPLGHRISVEQAAALGRGSARDATK